MRFLIIVADTVRAKIKMPDLNCFDIEAAMNSVKGTARSMGVDVV